MQPDGLAISDNSKTLILCWPDASSSRIDVALLWAECPSAQQRRRRLDGKILHAPDDLTIVRVTPVGHYAVNIAFSDGHDRGVYPWHLLSAFAKRPGMGNFIIQPASADVVLV